MSSKPETLAAAMVKIHGPSAEHMARLHAEKFDRSRDFENRDLWLRVADFVANFRAALGRGQAARSLAVK